MANFNFCFVLSYCCLFFSLLLVFLFPDKMSYTFLISSNIFNWFVPWEKLDQIYVSVSTII